MQISPILKLLSFVFSIPATLSSPKSDSSSLSLFEGANQILIPSIDNDQTNQLHFFGFSSLSSSASNPVFLKTSTEGHLIQKKSFTRTGPHAIQWGTIEKNFTYAFGTYWPSNEQYHLIILKNNATDLSLTRAWTISTIPFRLVSFLRFHALENDHFAFSGSRAIGQPGNFLSIFKTEEQKINAAFSIFPLEGGVLSTSIFQGNDTWWLGGYINTKAYLTQLKVANGNWSEKYTSIYSSNDGAMIFNNLLLVNQTLFATGRIGNNGLVIAINPLNGEAIWANNYFLGETVSFTKIFHHEPQKTLIIQGFNSDSTRTFYLMLNTLGNITHKNIISSKKVITPLDLTILNDESIAAVLRTNAHATSFQPLFLKFNSKLGIAPEILSPYFNTSSHFNITVSPLALTITNTSSIITPYTNLTMREITHEFSENPGFVLNTIAQKTATPSPSPSSKPSHQPTSQPSKQPTAKPSQQPSSRPTAKPYPLPTHRPSSRPTNQPTNKPSGNPSGKPSRQPTSQPSKQPTAKPSQQPSSRPTAKPYPLPTHRPSSRPTNQPTNKPSGNPSGKPSRQPTSQPSKQPTAKPSQQPSSRPTAKPYPLPTHRPSSRPTNQPTNKPSGNPSGKPSRQPTSQPSKQPTAKPSQQPSSRPTAKPYPLPTHRPSSRPTNQPTNKPSGNPSGKPSRQPTSQPSKQPTAKPSQQPSSRPTAKPYPLPTHRPSSRPTRRPHSFPTSSPSRSPTGFQIANWTALVDMPINQQTKFVGLSQWHRKTIACGNNISAFCLQFDNPNGALSATYPLPWLKINQFIALNKKFLFVGALNQTVSFVIQSDRAMQSIIWGYSIPATSLLTISINNDTQKVIVAGHNTLNHSVAMTFSLDNGTFEQGYTYSHRYFNHLIKCSIAKNQTTHLIGTIFFPYAKSSYPSLMRLDNAGQVTQLNTLINENTFSTQGLANDCISASESTDMYVTGSSPQYGEFITRRTENFEQKWSLIYPPSSRFKIAKIYTLENVLYVLGHTDNTNTFLLKLDALSGEFLKGIRMFSLNTLSCNTLANIDNTLKIAGSIDSKLLLFSVHPLSLEVSVLPKGVEIYHDAEKWLTWNLKSSLKAIDMLGSFNPQPVAIGDLLTALKGPIFKQIQSNPPTLSPSTSPQSSSMPSLVSSVTNYPSLSQNSNMPTEQSHPKPPSLNPTIQSSKPTIPVTQIDNITNETPPPSVAPSRVVTTSQSPTLFKPLSSKPSVSPETSANPSASPSTGNKPHSTPPKTMVPTHFRGSWNLTNPSNTSSIPHVLLNPGFEVFKDGYMIFTLIILASAPLLWLGRCTYERFKAMNHQAKTSKSPINKIETHNPDRLERGEQSESSLSVSGSSLSFNLSQESQLDEIQSVSEDSSIAIEHMFN